MNNNHQIECTFKNTETGITFVMKIDSELPLSQLVQKINSKVINELKINGNYHIIKLRNLHENRHSLNLDSKSKFKELKCVAFYIKPINNINQG